jgi:ribosomal protein S18 acetylase RimI-like enzyme
VIIRRAGISDLKSLQPLVKDCISDMQAKGLEQWPDWYPDENVLNNDINESSLFVAEEKDKIIGMVVLNPEVPEIYKTIQWKINSKKINSIHRLAVHPIYKTPGLAKELVKYVEELASRNGYTAIRLDTYSENMAANKFYRKMGYQYAGDINLTFMPGPYHCFEKAI